jgi:mersacidin/lichenicidin family type 2 lantibiotic
MTKVKENPMSHEKIIRAWKDLDYRLSLSEAERAQLPDHPAGLVELTEKESEPLVGGNGNLPIGNLVRCSVIITLDPWSVP